MNETIKKQGDDFTNRMLRALPHSESLSKNGDIRWENIGVECKRAIKRNATTLNQVRPREYNVLLAEKGDYVYVIPPNVIVRNAWEKKGQHGGLGMENCTLSLLKKEFQKFKHNSNNVVEIQNAIRDAHKEGETDLKMKEFTKHFNTHVFPKIQQMYRNSGKPYFKRKYTKKNI